MNQFNEECPSEIVPQRPNVEVYKFNIVRLRILKAFKAFAGLVLLVQNLHAVVVVSDFCKVDFVFVR